MIVRDSEARLRRSLEDSQRREDDLKRRISELEGGQNDGEPAAKKPRTSDAEAEPSDPSPTKSQSP